MNIINNLIPKFILFIYIGIKQQIFIYKYIFICIT